MAEFRIGDFTYKAGKIDAFRQFDLIRRLSPVFASGIGELIPLLMELRAQSETEGAIDLGAVSKDKAFAALEPVAKALAKLSDDDSRFIIATCMSVVERKPDGGSWTRVWNNEANISMFADINNDLSIILKIVVQVIKENFENFLPALLSD